MKSLGLAIALAFCMVSGTDNAQTPPSAAPSLKLNFHANRFNMPDPKMLEDIQKMSDDILFEFQPMMDNMHGPLLADLKLPHGTWWRDVELVKRIALSTDQQKRIEDLFLQNKIQLIHMHASLEEEELLLQPTLDGNPPDQTKALAQIGKIADTRADLEKANAKMLLGIRGLLTSDQWTRLQAERTAREQQSQRTLKEMMERMQHGRDTMKLHTTHPPAKPDGSLVLPALPNMPELTLSD